MMKYRSILILLILLLGTQTCIQAQHFKLMDATVGSEANIVDLAFNSSGDVIVLGEMDGTVNFDPGNSNRTVFNHGLSDYFIASYTKTGYLNWLEVFGGFSSSERPNYLHIDANDNIYFSSDFNGTVDLDNSGNIPGDTRTSVGGWDCLVAKYSPSGDFLWSKHIIGSDIFGRRFTLTSSGK